MNNYEEIIDALKAGETLINVKFMKVKLEDGELVSIDPNNLASTPNFERPEIWQIYKKPAWYNNIPDGGVLCWVCNVEVDVFPRKNLEVIKSYVPNSQYGFDFVSLSCAVYKRATPLIRLEVNSLLNNVPEDL